MLISRSQAKIQRDFERGDNLKNIKSLLVSIFARFEAINSGISPYFSENDKFATWAFETSPTS